MNSMIYLCMSLTLSSGPGSDFSDRPAVPLQQSAEQPEKNAIKIDTIGVAASLLLSPYLRVSYERSIAPRISGQVSGALGLPGLISTFVTLTGDVHLYLIQPHEKELQGLYVGPYTVIGQISSPLVRGR